VGRRCRAPQHKSGAMYGVHTEESTESTMEYGVQRAHCCKNEEGLPRLRLWENERVIGTYLLGKGQRARLQWTTGGGQGF
jgi:hypothetical protein